MELAREESIKAVHGPSCVDDIADELNGNIPVNLNAYLRLLDDKDCL